jgi:peroxiredoxin
MYKKWFFIFLALILVSCNRGKTIRISGSISGMSEGSKVILEELQVETSNIIDSCKASQDGEFQFKVAGKESPEFLRLRLDKNKYITLLALPGEHVEISGKIEDIPAGYQVKGSDGSSLVQSLETELARNSEKIDSLVTLYKALSPDPDADEVRTELEGSYTEVFKGQKKFTIGFVITHYNSMASILALYQKLNDSTWVLDSPRDIQYFKIVSDSLGKRYPQSNHVKALRADLNRKLAGHRARVLEQMANNAPVGYPNIILPDQQGDTIQLRSLAGKVILLNFWISTSSTSLMQNREFAALYKTYKSRGLEVYSVSLDTDKKKWEETIRENAYPWIDVFEGVSSTSRVAVLYNISKLPTFYLIDKKGDIAGKDLDEKTLRNKIAELTSK